MPKARPEDITNRLRDVLETLTVTAVLCGAAIIGRLIVATFVAQWGVLFQ